MAKQVINNLESGAVVRNKINSNFTELYDEKASKNHAFTDSSYGGATSNLYGHVKVDTSNGLTINDGLLGIAKSTPNSTGSVQLADSLDIDDPNRALSASQGKLLNDTVKELRADSPPKNHAVSNSDYGLATSSLYGHVKVTDGNGLFLNQGTITLAPASTEAPGGVQLEDTLTSQSTTKALTANMGYDLDRRKPDVFYGEEEPTSTIGRNGDIYFLIEKK